MRPASREQGLKRRLTMPAKTAKKPAKKAAKKK
jgi:hypothetical protein